MPNERQSGRQQIDAVLDALGDYIQGATDDDLRAQANESGEDLAAINEDVKLIFYARLRASRRQRRDDLRTTYRTRADSRPARGSRLPRTFDEKRALLGAILASRPQFDQMLTTQHRKFSELTEEDLDSYLEELAELGVLDEIENSES
jgi:DNA anti-recombination protein RmuC